MDWHTRTPAPTPSANNTPHWLQKPAATLGIACAVFLLSRIFILLFQCVMTSSGDNDVRLYARYAHACELATLHGKSVYDYVDIEYPPLSVVSMLLPELCANPATDGRKMSPEFFARYRVAYRLEMAVADLCSFLLAIVLVRRFFREETPWQQTQRLLLFGLGGLALGPILYTRLDALLATLMLASLALLLSRRHYVWSFAVLAAAIDYKVIPIVLAPVWVAATLRQSELAGLLRLRQFPHLALVCVRRLGVLAGLTVGLFLPFYLLWGPGSLSFFGYHRDRGLEIESLYATVLLAARELGQQIEVYVSHSSVNVRSADFPYLVPASPFVVGGLLLLATGLLARATRRSAQEQDMAGQTLGQARPRTIVAFTVLFLLLFIAGNKVFSPQYLLWVLPLLPLLPLSQRTFRLSAATYLGAFGLTSLIMLLWSVQIQGVDLGTGPNRLLSGPTELGVALIVARNVLFVLVTVVLMVEMVRRTTLEADVSLHQPVTPGSPRATSTPARQAERVREEEWVHGVAG